MSAAWRATFVPATFMAKPTSARRRAGASLVPSPMAATTCREGCTPSLRPSSVRKSSESMRPETRRCLSSGELRASTRRCGQTSSKLFWSNSLSRRTFSRNTPPVIAVYLCARAPLCASKSMPGRRMPHCLAMATAVARWSPVTMTMATPARRHCSIAGGTSGRMGSWMPTRPRKVRPVSTAKVFAVRPVRRWDSARASSPSQSGGASKSRKARATVRIAREEKASMAWAQASRRASPRGAAEPSSAASPAQSCRTSSLAPLT
mmetsp:Transcript_88767/g.287429  ORF Transcript_88767/g.287429 Transcript_88767/m.287429 type:complete len:263 (+) Transcript_88767:978-1766(+)